MKSHLIKSLIFLSLIFCIGIVFNYVFTNTNIEGYENTILDSNSNMRVIVHPYDFFRYNITSPDCYKHNIHNRYTNGSGFTCLTDQQKYILQTRGGNNY